METLQQNHFVEVECPLEITWKISRTSNRFQNFIQRRSTVIHSPSFKCPRFDDVEYRLSLEHINDQRYDFTFYLSKMGANIEANFVVEVAGQFRNEKNYTFTQDFLNCGFCCFQIDHMLSTRMPADKYFVNDILTFKLKGTLKRTKPLLPLQGFKNIMLNLWNDDEKDFTIITEDHKEFYVHKNILRASSPVFAGMLKSGMKEAVENKVEIKGFDLVVIETAMKYCYGLDICNPLPLVIAMSLLHFTDIYDIEGLKDFLESFLIDKMDVTNVAELQECSIYANSPKLEQKCLKFLKSNAEKTFCHVCETF